MVSYTAQSILATTSFLFILLPLFLQPEAFSACTRLDHSYTLAQAYFSLAVLIAGIVRYMNVHSLSEQELLKYLCVHQTICNWVPTIWRCIVVGYTGNSRERMYPGYNTRNLFNKRFMWGWVPLGMVSFSILCTAVVIWHEPDHLKFPISQASYPTTEPSTPTHACFTFSKRVVPFGIVSAFGILLPVLTLISGTSYIFPFSLRRSQSHVLGLFIFFFMWLTCGAILHFWVLLSMFYLR